MTPNLVDRDDPFLETASAIKLVERYDALLIFPRVGQDKKILGDALDQAPTNTLMILNEQHSAFVWALVCDNLEDFLDFLTRACLLGRLGKENPLAFTHVTPSAADFLARTAMLLNVANVFRSVKERQDTRVAKDGPDGLSNISPNRLVALVPVFDPGQQKRIGVMHVMDPREGGLDDGEPDPLAAVISVGEVGYPHADAGYWEALQAAQTPPESSLREMQDLLRGSLQRYMSAVRMARLQLGILDKSDDSDDGDLN